LFLLAARIFILAVRYFLLLREKNISARKLFLQNIFLQQEKNYFAKRRTLETKKK